MSTIRRNSFLSRFSTGIPIHSPTLKQTLQKEGAPRSLLQWLDGNGDGVLREHELQMLFQFLDHHDRNGSSHSFQDRGKAGRLYHAFRKAAQVQSPPSSLSTGDEYTEACCGVSDTATLTPLSVVEIAQRYLGVKEATGKNDGAPAWLFSDGRKEAWCANFIKTIFTLAGKPLPGRWNRLQSSSEMLRQLARKGAFFKRGEKTPKPGDIVFFKQYKGPWPATHVGLVLKVEGDRLITIEGNYASKVKQLRHRLNSREIVGYGRWITKK